jgi:hypothetical protein
LVLKIVDWAIFASYIHTGYTLAPQRTDLNLLRHGSKGWNQPERKAALLATTSALIRNKGVLALVSA